MLPAATIAVAVGVAEVGVEGGGGGVKVERWSRNWADEDESSSSRSSIRSISSISSMMIIIISSSH